MTDLFTSVADRPESRALTRGLWARRAILVVLCAFVLAALADAFGEGGSTTAARGPSATLALGAPKAVRGGLFFQARIDIRALQDVQHPRLVLGRGWTEGMQVNSIEPNPMGETSRDGLLVLSFDQLSAGDRSRIWVQFQVDPTQPGRRAFDLELDDAERPIARIHRTLTVLP